MKAVRTADTIRRLEADHIVQFYRRAPVVFALGQGSRLYDLDGRPFLDLVSGAGTAALGHAHPRLASVIAEQARTLLQPSNLYYQPFQGELASRLAGLTGLPRVFFSNSGTEAVETALKLARRYWHTRGETGRTEIVALEHAFHGRTLGSLSVTWEERYRRPFAPLLGGIKFVPPNDPDRLLAAVSSSTAAIIFEPVQGDGGMRPLTPAFAQAAERARAATGALLIADEVQCGLGRTGHALHSLALELRPDLVAVGKGLGAGLPIAATLASEAVAETVAYGDHGCTQGGNLITCRAALVFLDELENGLLAHVRRAGAHLEQGLRALSRKHEMIIDIRGAGLMWGIELPGDAAPVVEAALHRGLLIHRHLAAPAVVRLLPPLTISEAELDEALEILDAALGAAPAAVDTGAA
ncbi:MAG: acetylornithine transaminase [Acidobacteria bacterium]|nr:acetylornithine transaminase [Acidobacteriota bacterium]